MNFFLGNVFEYYKDRRVAAIFFGTLMALGGLILAGLIFYRIICAYELQNYMMYSLPVMALILIARVWRGIVLARARRRDRYKISPMSRDELAKARSKLVRTKP